MSITVFEMYSLYFSHLADAVPWVSYLIIRLLNSENIKKQKNP